MKIRDFTPAEAERWVQQEIAKHNDIASIDARIATERMMLDLMLPDAPESTKAHRKLLNWLCVKRAAVIS